MSITYLFQLLLLSIKYQLVLYLLNYYTAIFTQTTNFNSINMQYIIQILLNHIYLFNKL